MKNLGFQRIYNARDFADSICGKKTVKSRLLIRSGNVANVSQTDAKLLSEYGIKTIIDIRSQKEKSLSSHFFENIEGITYKFIDFDADNIFCGLNTSPEDTPIGKKTSITQAYISLLENKETVSQILRCIISSLSEGGVLFHSTMGKDRVGIISMLIQFALGMSKEDILKDYHQSYESLSTSEISQIYNDDLIYCSPLYLSKTIKYVEEKYGSVLAYFYSIIEEKEITLLRESLLENVCPSEKVF